MASALPTVVIIDDSDQLRQVVRSRLERSQLFDVLADGRDGTEAIGLAFQHQPALLLLDTSMPSMDGLEALPGILAVAPETHVVIYTGFSERNLAGVAKELGAVDFIEKSYPIEQLPDRLRGIVDGAGVRSPSGSPRPATGFAAVSNDRDQAVLHDHLERFREIFDMATIGMATLTLNGTIVQANRALSSLLRSDPENLIGVDYGRLTCGQGDQLDNSLQAIVAGDDLASFEHEIAGYAEPRCARSTVSGIRDPAGAPLYVLLQVQDITDQRAAELRFRSTEQRFRLLISAVKEYAIFMLDTEGKVASWNAGAERIKGYRAEEIIGRHFRVFYPKEQQDSRHPEDELRIALERGTYSEDGWRIRKDGSRFWASVVITAVFDDAGRHIGFAKVTRDQTEQRLADQEREQALGLQSQLLAVTGHELRTPTAVIEGSVNAILQRDRLPAAEREHLLSGVRNSTRRLQQLASDLLTASRRDAETLTVNPVMITLETILCGAADRAKIADPTVDISVTGDLAQAVLVDPVRIGQAIDNLITNAVRHGSPPIRITGTVSPDGDGRDQVVIMVSDAGPGVDPAVQDRLFERFAAGSRTGGAGLGLYVVREVARMHDGDAHYEAPQDSQPGRFVLTLPRRGQPEPE